MPNLLRSICNNCSKSVKYRHTTTLIEKIKQYFAERKRSRAEITTVFGKRVLIDGKITTVSWQFTTVFGANVVIDEAITTLFRQLTTDFGKRVVTDEAVTTDLWKSPLFFEQLR